MLSLQLKRNVSLSKICLKQCDIVEPTVSRKVHFQLELLLYGQVEIFRLHATNVQVQANYNVRINVRINTDIALICGRAAKTL